MAAGPEVTVNAVLGAYRAARHAGLVALGGVGRAADGALAIVPDAVAGDATLLTGGLGLAGAEQGAAWVGAGSRQPCARACNGNDCAYVGVTVAIDG